MQKKKEDSSSAIPDCNLEMHTTSCVVPLAWICSIDVQRIFFYLNIYSKVGSLIRRRGRRGEESKGLLGPSC